MNEGLACLQSDLECQMGLGRNRRDLGEFTGLDCELNDFL